jgi:glyoxylase-like metal-dependent hydrolase (beta-lactamase superfamily II)
MAEETQTQAAPIVPDVAPEEIADGVYVIPDHRINLVPNIGIITGERAVLVVDTGMGPRNGERVLEKAREVADRRPLYLTLTHFHPEHGFGAQAFAPEVPLFYNRVQRDELAQKGEPFVEMFRTFGPDVAEQLEGVALVMPQIVYEEAAEVDLGGRTVHLRHYGQAHTFGDQVAWLPEERILFAGDLVENRFFPILPDEGSSGRLWISVLALLEGLGPETVVPGHGEVGDAGLIRDAREYLSAVRSLVHERHRAGQGLEEMKAELEPEIRERWADWDNEIWIGFATENFYGDLARTKPSAGGL